MNDATLRETRLWTLRYRRLMKGGLSNVVHIAAADPDDEQHPRLTVNAVEELLGEHEQLRQSVRRIAAGLEAALDDEHADRQYAAEKTLDALRALVQS